MRPTLVRREFGKVLYGPQSTLPQDFFRCCAGYFGITFHKNVFIGVRTSQQRGLFMAEAVAANEPIATIPLSAMYNLSNIGARPSTMRGVTLDDVRDAISDAEFKMMAPQLYMGLHFAALTAALPDLHKARSAEEEARAEEVLRSQAMPWARMLDDEDFNEEFLTGMYGMALDTWQRRSYDELTAKFHTATAELHEALRPPFDVKHLRRLSRLVLARVEHMPPTDYYDGPAWRRRLARRLRKLCRRPEPTELAMVPLLDLINHSNRPNCIARVGPAPPPPPEGAGSAAVPGSGGAITIRALTHVDAGREICRHYNFALSRPNALFRYGFLPFDLIAIEEQDSVHETFVRDKVGFHPEEEEKVKRDKEIESEVKRLEKIYKQARLGKK